MGEDHRINREHKSLDDIGKIRVHSGTSQLPSSEYLMNNDFTNVKENRRANVEIHQSRKFVPNEVKKPKADFERPVVSRTH